MNYKIFIRPATAADAQVGAYLIHMTMSRLAGFLLGSNNPAKVNSVLSKLFAQRQNRFSYQFADIAEVNGQVAGLSLSYPSRIMKHLEMPMAKQLLRILGMGEFIRFTRSALPLSRMKEAGADEHYINNLAVLPNFQGQGIGTRLLAFVESKAKAAGLGICSLTVEIGNERACHLYERLGYRLVGTVELQRLSHGVGFKGYYRMAKAL
jgi:ribosomal protein S18 acetylase RimI-like enzyme